MQTRTGEDKRKIQKKSQIKTTISLQRPKEAETEETDKNINRQKTK